MSATDDPPTEPVVERARERVLQTLLVWRARALPLFSTMALGFMWLDPRPWRIALLSTVGITLTAISLVELRAVRRGVPLTMNRVRVNLVISGLCQLGMMVGSGGLASPIAPAVLIVALMFNLSAPRRLAAIFVLTVHIPAVWLLAAAHVYGVVPGLVPFTTMSVTGEVVGGAIVAFAYTAFFLAAVTLGQWIRATLDAAVDERVAEQQRLLELHRETARTMSALSSELAHELKNPLASIKGLAGLLRRDVPEGHGKERLEVMRGEIDRMQAILEELLNYSRPVVPLELRATGIAALVREVVALHEGMALARQVTIEAPSGEELLVTCDPRKVRQILVNLVQNAIEASPTGGRVEIGLRSENARVVLDVDDRGGGLDPSIRGALFDVGATTKAKGSGIGLAIARGLARQHEGELTLDDREGGGCRARLVLPIEGPHVAAPAETAAAPIEAAAHETVGERREVAA
ncbi:MAG: HAMP domain-containing histidine kinase [Sandaracinaceae bacterium]|nr:HAMP domain-containing histidine kinase [Sandaracinaceae bacterium]